MAKINTRIVRRSVGLLDASILHHSDRGASIDPSCQLYAPEFSYSEAALAPDEPTAVKMAVCTQASIHVEGGHCSHARWHGPIERLLLPLSTLTLRSPLCPPRSAFSALLLSALCPLPLAYDGCSRPNRSREQRAASAPASKLKEMVDAGRLPMPGQGPDEETRRSSWFKFTFLAEGAEGARLAGTVSGGDPGYDETAKMISESAVQLATAGPQTLPGGDMSAFGFQTPATALGAPLRQTLHAEGIKFEDAPLP